MTWHALTLTANLLRERGLHVVAVWTPDSGLTPQTVYVRWQSAPSPDEIVHAERYVFAPTIHHLTLSDRPDGCPW